jgi:hypothetical protein
MRVARSRGSHVNSSVRTLALGLLFLADLAHADPKWRSFETGAGPLVKTGAPTQLHRFPGAREAVTRDHEIWLPSSFFGWRLEKPVNGNPAYQASQPFVLDVRTLRWRPHTLTSYAEKQPFDTPIPGRGQHAPPQLPRDGRTFNFVFRTLDPAKPQSYFLAAHDYVRDRWTELTSKLVIRPNTTVYTVEVGDRIVQLGASGADHLAYANATVIDPVTRRATPLFASVPPPEVTKQRVRFASGVGGDAIAVVGGTTPDGWLHDLRTGRTTTLPPLPEIADLVFAGLCVFADRLLYVERGGKRHHVLDRRDRTARWKTIALPSDVTCDPSTLLGVEDRGTQLAIRDIDLATGTVKRVPLPASARDASKTRTPDGDKLVFAPTASWRGGYYSRAKRRWVDFPRREPSAGRWLVTAATNRAAVVWGFATIVQMTPNPCLERRGGCESVPPTIIERVDPRGSIIDF